MKIVRGKRKKYLLTTRFIILLIMMFAIFKIIQQRIKILELERENEKISAIINNE